MAGKILRRCDLCGKFHAAYLVDAPDLGGKVILCQTCWKARYGQPPPPSPTTFPSKPPDTKDTSLNNQ